MQGESKANVNYSSRSSTLSNHHMSLEDFKSMCIVLKVFPAVVSEESVEKVLQFCAMQKSNTKAETSEPALEFGDFIRALKVKLTH